MNNQVYTVPEVAALLHVNRNTLYGLIAKGAFPCIRLGRSIKISAAQLESFLAGGVAQ
jgi:excisionase family DNA binding protein